MNTVPHVLVPIADGCEEIETVSILDVLRRAGVSVTFASLPQPQKQEPIVVHGSNGINLLCDTYLTEAVLKAHYDMITLPGGTKNAQSLSQYTPLIDRLKQQKLNGLWVTAICASPALVLEKHGLLEGEVATCYPSFGDQLKSKNRQEERVIVSNKIITSRGPGTALEFALQLVEVLFDAQKAAQLAKGMLIRR